MGSSISKSQANTNTFYDEKRMYFVTLPSDLPVPSLPISKPNLKPESVDGSLTLSNIASWESVVSSDPKQQLARTILSHSNINSALQARSAQIADAHCFNTEIDFKTGPVTNQKSSGRCWLFATTNVLRYDVMKKLKLKDFQLSQVRIMFRLLACNILLNGPVVLLVLLGQIEQVELLS